MKTDTISNPRAMVIHIQNTSFTSKDKHELSVTLSNGGIDQA